MTKKLAASFLLVACLFTAVGVVVPRLQPDPRWSIALQVSLDVVIGLGASILVARLLTRRLRLLASVATEIRDGDLTRRIDVRGDDETAELARAFSGMQDGLALLVNSVRENAERIHASAAELSGTATRMNGTTAEIAAAARGIAVGAEGQAKEVRRTSDLTRDLAKAVDRIADAAHTVSTAAEETSGKAEHGVAEARRAGAGIVEVAAKTNAAAEAVARFRKQADEIGQAIAFIASLSQQTQLLAINAAIEAARAGDEARGFGVVADEVRRLADAVSGFAEQISTLSGAIQEGSRQLAEGIHESLGAAEEARRIVDGAGVTFDGILESARQAAGRAQEIASLTRSQRDAALEVDGALSHISEIAASSVAGTEETSSATLMQNASMESLADAAQQLARSSDELKGLIASFRTAG